MLTPDHLSHHLSTLVASSLMMTTYSALTALRLWPALAHPPDEMEARHPPHCALITLVGLNLLQQKIKLWNHGGEAELSSTLWVPEFFVMA